jgi:endonuclease/exonuclease/phosphatase family metal-dependent hydrolase
MARVRLAEKQRAALDALRMHLDETTIWGGDWNQALEGNEYVGSLDGRSQITELIETAYLSVPTRSLGSATSGQRSIDHIAVPMDWDVDGAHRVSAETDGYRLSDHDVYVISIDR